MICCVSMNIASFIKKYFAIKFCLKVEHFFLCYPTDNLISFFL